MTDYYDPTGEPGTSSSGDSVDIRNEFIAIQTGVSNKLPTITGNALQIVRINAGASAQETVAIVPVAQGGTGAATLTDGGILLGSGTGAITALAVLDDGEMIVGDGTTDPAIESGAILRTSIGVGTGDNVTFTNIIGTGTLAITGTSTVAAVTASGVISVDDTTQSTSTVTGSIHTDGGLGVVKDVFIGGTVGISEASPQALIHVTGVDATGAAYPVTGNGIIIEEGTSSPFLQFASPSGATAKQFIYFGDEDHDIGSIAYDHLTNKYFFVANTVEILQISDTSVTIVPTTGQLILPSSNDATTPTLAFGAGADTGLYENSANELSIAVGGVQLVGMASGEVSVIGTLHVNDAAGGAILNEASTANNPTLIPNRADVDTGVGWALADSLSLIAGGNEVIRANATSLELVGTINLVTATTTGPSILNEAATSTNPTLIPNGADPDTGIGWSSANVGSLVAGGAAAMTWNATTLAPLSTGTTQTAFIIDTTTQTTGDYIQVAKADSLTEGHIAHLLSNSPSTTARSLFEVGNDNTAAVNTYLVDLQQDADNAFINFKGASSGASTSDAFSTLTTSGAVQGHIQIDIAGVKRWIAVLADPS